MLISVVIGDSSLVILRSPSVVGCTLPMRNPSTSIAGLGVVLSLFLTIGVVVLVVVVTGRVVSRTKLKLGLGLFLLFCCFFT